MPGSGFQHLLNPGWTDMTGKKRDNCRYLLAGVSSDLILSVHLTVCLIVCQPVTVSVRTVSPVNARWFVDFSWKNRLDAKLNRSDYSTIP